MQTTWGPAFVPTLMMSGLLLAYVANGNAREPQPPGSDEVVLTFRGQIDGSDQIEINDRQAMWRHTHWDLPPEPVMLNGISWDPRVIGTLENQGATRFLPAPVDFASIRLNRIEGRDTVAIERGKDSVVIHLSDSPAGHAPYEFQVVFRRKGDGRNRRTRPPSVRETLRIVADIDGSDELHIGDHGARWVHREWDWPREVRLNNVSWRPQEKSTLPNEGKARFLGDNVDLSTARISRKEGRDTAVLQCVDGGIVIHFADNPPGRSTYDLTVTFGD